MRRRPTFDVFWQFLWANEDRTEWPDDVSAELRRESFRGQSHEKVSATAKSVSDPPKLQVNFWIEVKLGFAPSASTISPNAVYYGDARWALYYQKVNQTNRN